jgi:excisionase family DNA binding protein
VTSSGTEQSPGHELRLPVTREPATFDGPKKATAGVNGDHLLAAADVAELLAVPERWVRDQTRSGLIPHIRLGRYVRYRRAAVIAWIDERERGGAARRDNRPRVPELVESAAE